MSSVRENPRHDGSEVVDVVRRIDPHEQLERRFVLELLELVRKDQDWIVEDGKRKHPEYD